MSASADSAHIQIVQFSIQYSSLALIYYDYSLTFGRELKYIWGRPFHFLTIMYFFCRYSLLSNAIYFVGLSNKYMHMSCDTAYIVSAAIGVLGRIGVITILGARTSAMFDHHPAVACLFIAMGLVVIISAILHVPQVSCTGAKLFKLSTANSRIATDLVSTSTVVYEIISTIFLAIGCARSMKMVGPMKLPESSTLAYLMLKEGFLYTGFVTAFTTTAMILNYAAPAGSFFQRLLNALTMPISGIMSARFLLHVREWHGSDEKSETHDIPAVDSGMPSFASQYREQGPETGEMDEDRGPSYDSQRSHPAHSSFEFERYQCSEVGSPATLGWTHRSEPSGSSSTSRMV